MLPIITFFLVFLLAIQITKFNLTKSTDQNFFYLYVTYLES